MNESTRARHKAWLELLRPPNLLTVPGDPIAGYLLAAPEQPIEISALLGAVAAALFFYASGLISNDWCDREEDRRARPGRPIPAGRVSAEEALVVWIILMAAALCVCWLMGPWTWQAGAALAATILLYNIGFKRIRFLGAFTMGLCRGFSLLLGAAAARGPHAYVPPVMLAFDLMVLYVGSITHLAREETTPHRIGGARWAPAFVLAAGFACFAFWLPSVQTANLFVFVGGFVFAGAAALIAGDVFERMLPRDAPRALFFLDRELRNWMVPRLVGLLLSTLLMLQAALVAAAGGTGEVDSGDFSVVLAVTLLALWPVHRILAQYFYES